MSSGAAFSWMGKGWAWVFTSEQSCRNQVMGSIQSREGEWACSLIILNFTSSPLLVSILVSVQLDKKQDIKYCNRKKKYGELVLENWKAIKDQWGEIRDRNCRKRLPPRGPGKRKRVRLIGHWSLAAGVLQSWHPELEVGSCLVGGDIAERVQCDQLWECTNKAETGISCY